VDAKGDLIVGTADNVIARLGVGTDGQVLTASTAQTSGLLWSTPSGGGAVTSVAGRTGAVTLTSSDVGLGSVANTLAIPAATVTTKADLIVANGSGAAARLPVGTDGQVLTAAASQTLGLQWATPTGGGGVTSVAGRTGAVVLTSTDVNLGNVTNTAQVPASLLNAQAALASANSSGVPGKLDASANFGGEVLTSDLSAPLGLKWAFPAYGIVQKASASFPSRAALNFIGAGVTVADSGGAATNVTIAGAGVSPSVTLTDAATITTDASLGNYFRVTLGGNRTLGAPTNLSDGQILTFELIQDATGSRTITLNAIFALGTTVGSVTLTTTALKRDFLTGIYNSTTAKIYCTQFVKGY
jgi:hypothetical protein